MRCDRVGEVASGGAADDVEAELLRVSEGDGDDAILEAEGGKADGVVLDVEVGSADTLAEIFCTYERGKAYGEVGLEAFGDGEESGVTPDIGRAGCDVFSGEDAAGGFEVIGDLEGGEAVGACGERLVAKSLAALVALQLVPATGVVLDALSEGKGS